MCAGCGSKVGFLLVPIKGKTFVYERWCLKCNDVSPVTDDDIKESA